MDDLRSPEPAETAVQRIERRLRTRPGEAAARRCLKENRSPLGEYRRV